jgi:DNA-binding response OmpR family regulator
MAAGLDDAKTLRRSRELGAADYVTKPINPERLLTVIRRATGIAAPEPSVGPREILPRSATTSQRHVFEAEYALETPVRCPSCGEQVTTLAAIRLVRNQVNFTSTLPRRGRVIVCPQCCTMVPAELTNF